MMMIMIKINQDDYDHYDNDDNDGNHDIFVWFYLNYIWRIRPCTMGDIMAASI